ncbi:MAG TPA: GlsB/YeaQ/YmgE family stress response membrane protein [Candidatus Competibacteraceae bacterium]|nr:GlsB/YeaQ/YmgE family stress response membrane protein [Candidatus Competibacteraceae bacterium]
MQDITAIVIFLVIGAVAGWLAGQIIKGGGFGLVGNIIVGIIGAIIGGVLFNFLGIATFGLLASIISATVGAVILLALIGLFKRA